MNNSEFNELITKAQEGDKDALDKLVNANIGLVYKIAKTMNTSSTYNTKDCFDVLVQEGSIQLMKSIMRFDISKGFKLSTYASYNIRGGMLRYLRDDNEASIFRVPRQCRADSMRIHKEKELFIQENRREPTFNELYKRLDLSSRDLELGLKALDRYTSIYSPVNPGGEEESALWEEIIPNSLNDNEDEIAIKIDIENAMNLLNENHRKIIDLRYYQNKSQSETARILKTNQARISRLEKKALNELKTMLEGAM